MNLNKIIIFIAISPNERRLRSGWRLLIQTITMVVFGAGLGFLLTLLPISIPLPPGGMISSQIVAFVVITGSIYLARVCSTGENSLN